MKSNLMLFIFFISTCAGNLQANEGAISPELVRIAVSNGQVSGQLFAMLGTEKAPLVGKIALTTTDGKTITTAESDDAGKFVFTDVTPGNYKAVGIAGDYVGDTNVEVFAVSSSEEPETQNDDESVYTSIPLAVAPAPSPAIFEMYSSLPAASFSSTPSLGSGQVISLGDSSGCCTTFSRGSGFNFRRLALIGTAIAIPVALSGGDDDPATPEE